MALPQIPQPPMGVGADESGAATEYNKAITSVLKSLEERNRNPNWFSVAGQLLDPGRTGSAGEAIGRASTALGAEMERQREREPNIAMMRAQLAGTKYTMEKDAEAGKMLANVLQMGSPAEATQAVASGNLSEAQMNKLASVYPTLARLSPKTGEIVKNVFDMQSKIGEATRGTRKIDAEVLKEALANPEQIPYLIRMGALPSNFNSSDYLSSQAPAPSRPSSPLTATPSGDTSAGTSTVPTAPSAAAPTMESTMPKTAPAEAAPRAPGFRSTASAREAEKAEIGVQQKRAEELDKPALKLQNEIMEYTPTVINQSNLNLNRIDQLVSRSPKAFGLLVQDKSLMNGLMNLAEKGVQGGIGPAQLNVGVPVQEFLKGKNLSKQEKEDLILVSRYIASEFLSNLKTQRGLLGLNPTDNDARLLQAPMGKPEDSARALQIWARQAHLTNEMRADLYKSLQQFRKQSGKKVDPDAFFQSNLYNSIVEQHRARALELDKKLGVLE